MFMALYAKKLEVAKLLLLESRSYASLPGSHAAAAALLRKLPFSTPAATPTSITVIAASASETVGTTQQLTATVQYSDGSSKSFPSSGTWSSSSSTTALVDSAGNVTALSPGTTTITASFSGLTGSSRITVPESTATTKFYLAGNTTDPLVLRAKDQANDTVEYFGHKDINGLPTSLGTLRSSNADGSVNTFIVDDQSRPVAARASNGAEFRFVWTSINSVLVTGISPDGTVQLNANVDVPSSVSPALLGHRKPPSLEDSPECASDPSATTGLALPPGD